MVAERAPFTTCDKIRPSAAYAGIAKGMGTDHPASDNVRLLARGPCETLPNINARLGSTSQCSHLHDLSDSPSTLLLFQRDLEVVFRPSAFGEACVTKAKQLNMFKKRICFGPCRLRRQGHKTTILLNMCGFWASAHQASKKPLGKIRKLRDSFQYPHSPMMRKRRPRTRS